MLRLSHRLWSATGRPYHRVLQAMSQEGRGLLVAAEVYKEFETAYREALSRSTTAVPSKPLTQYCGNPSELEPLTIILLKVLCDLRRMEEMRFLFTQCLLELDDSARPPSVELYNVYLLAISMTDSFNQHEVDNLVEVMRCKGTSADIISKLSMFLLYLRLGQDSCLGWWPMIREEVQAILDRPGAAQQYPLLPLRVQHCFQTLVRLHHDSRIIEDCYGFLTALSPQSCTPSLLLPYMLLAVRNGSSAPAHVVEVIKRMEACDAAREAEVTNRKGGPQSSGEQKTEAGEGEEAKDNPRGPILNSEVTVFRLLAKCAKWGDANSAAWLRSYLSQYPPVILPDNAGLASLCYLEALLASGPESLSEALSVLESELPAEMQTPIGRPKVFLASRHLLLLSCDPVQHLVDLLGTLPASQVTSLLQTQRRSGLPVSGATLNVVLAAIAARGDIKEVEAFHNAYTSSYGVAQSAHSYTVLLQAYAQQPTLGSQRMRTVQQEMASRGLDEGDASFLRAAVQLALEARDVNSALSLLEVHAARSRPMDSRLAGFLLMETALLGDAGLVGRAAKALRASQTFVDRRTFEGAVAVMRRLDPAGAAALHAEGA